MRPSLWLAAALFAAVAVLQAAGSPCDSQPCQNGGACRTRNGQFLCHCKPGFTGRTCNRRTNGTNCTYQGKNYTQGVFRPTPCQHCYCYGGHVINCTTTKCRPLTCSKPINVTGRCCPVCPNVTNGTNCTYQGKNYTRGVFRPTPCQHCYCYGGHVMNCTTTKCRPLTCAKPINVTGVCCPVCPNVTACSPKTCNGTCKQVGGVSICVPTQSPCASSPCLNGGVCRALLSSFFCWCKPGFTGKTCNRSTQTNGTNCTYHGKNYPQGMFRPTPCQHCFCYRGRVNCTMTRCRPLACSKPINVTGVCCPVCPNVTVCSTKTCNGTCQQVGGVNTCIPSCPPSAPAGACITDPCFGKTCARRPNATCVASYCGGCFATFYLHGRRVQCSTLPTSKPTTSPMKHGICPRPSNTTATCMSTCQVDISCKGRMKCCQSGCGGMRCACPILLCRMRCPNGYVKDAENCPLCACANKTTNLTLCQQLQKSVPTQPPRRGRRSLPQPGSYHPTCTKTGNFTPVQCVQTSPIFNLSSCFCVNVRTGVPRSDWIPQVNSQGQRYCIPKPTSSPRPNCSAAACLKYCPFGFQKDQNGCPICKCNPSPPTTIAVQTTPSGPKPTCSGIACLKFCPYGFQQDGNGCPICKCNTSPPTTIAVQTTPSGPITTPCRNTTCRKYCRYGFVIGPAGCTICYCNPPPTTTHMQVTTQPSGGCRYGNLTLANGQTISPTPCQHCTCTSSIVRCLTQDCARPPCSNPVHVPGRCCPVCSQTTTPVYKTTAPQPGCYYNGQRYQHGQTFSPSNCITCVCRNTSAACVRVPCPLPACPNPVTMPGSCCKTCPTSGTTATRPTTPSSSTCVYQNKTYSAGQFQPNPCLRCICSRGRANCAIVECPPKYACTKPVRVAGQCCLVCPSSTGSTGMPPSTAHSGTSEPTTGMPETFDVSFEVKADTVDAVTAILSTEKHNFAVYIAKAIANQYRISQDNVQDVVVTETKSTLKLLVAFELTPTAEHDESEIRQVKEQISGDVDQGSLLFTFSTVDHKEYKLVSAAVNGNAAQNTGNNNNNDSGLSTPAIAAIAVGGALALIVVIILSITLSRSRSKGVSRAPPLSDDGFGYTPHAAYSVSSGDMSINSTNPAFDQPLYDGDTQPMLDE